MFPISRLLSCLSIAVTAVLSLGAQQVPHAPALCRPSVLMSPYLAPVAHLPVTATFAIHLETPSNNTGAESLNGTFQVARDSKGRISHELRESAEPSSPEASSLLGVVLYDPRTQISRTLDSRNLTDVELQVHLHPPIVAEETVPASGRVKVENLGTQTVAGLHVKGIREMWGEPPQPSNTGQPGQTSVESWYSPDLHMIVAEKRTTPLGDVVAITLSAIDRGQPPASLFKVPSSYRVIRPKKRPVHTFGPNRWSVLPWPIPPPDYDPNDGSGGITNPVLSH